MTLHTSTVTGDPVQLARAFQALADDKRVRVLELLGDGERCVCELAEAIDITQPLLSFHLRTLREAGLVTDRRKGRWVHYSLNREAIDELVQAAEALASGAFTAAWEAGSESKGRCCQPFRRASQ
ncbi:MAG: ArsR/SmtB family transcription factor [Gemmatimonadota bacterium]